jgi:AraC family transcriptional regulator, melibiose operon regulatory protein
MAGIDPDDQPDEGTPLFREVGRDHPMVVFEDHRFCAGKSLGPGPMRRPHMHSQIEINFVLKGAMTYWFDGRTVTLTTHRLAVFWGMIPHQTTEVEAHSRFIVIYVPIAVFLGLSLQSQFREAVFGGSVVEASTVQSFDADLFVRWRDELLSDDETASAIARDEIVARIRRIDREGWRDLRTNAFLASVDARHDASRLIPVERMSRHIAERCRSDLSAEEVARASGLHPNYAMQLYKRAVGISIKQSILRNRLDAAQSMLVATDRPIASIAFDCGFGSLSNFYAAFDKRFAVSPAEFRKALSRRPSGRRVFFDRSADGITRSQAGGMKHGASRRAPDLERTD